MSDTPWYERNSVLWVAGAVLAIALLLAQPFVTRDWPTQLKLVLSTPLATAVLSTIAYVAVFALGFGVGSRVKTKRHAATTPRTAVVPPELPVYVEPAPFLHLVEQGANVVRDEATDDVRATVTWLATAANDDLILARADSINPNGSLWRAAMTVLERDGIRAVPKMTVPQIAPRLLRVRFTLPDDVVRPRQWHEAQVRITDSRERTVTRRVRLGPMPEPAPEWPDDRPPDEP